MYSYQCSLVRVVDGDTVDITIDLGFSITTKQRVRLMGLNAAEHNTFAGQESITYVKAWFAAHDRLTVESQKPGGGDKYGRYLATIKGVPTRGTTTLSCLNEDLVSSGHAMQWDGQGVKPT